MKFALSSLIHCLAHAIALAVVLASPANSATIYKCTGPDGNTIFADAPCGSDAKAQESVSQPRLSTGTAPSAPKPLSAEASPAARDKSARETSASLCGARAFNEWIKAQGHPLPDPKIRIAKMMEIRNDCRRQFDLPDLFVPAQAPAPQPILPGPDRDAAGAKLADVVKSGSVARLQQYLSTPGVDINDRPGSDEALLDYAAELNQADIARFLVEHGARVNAAQSRGPNTGFTALHRAAVADSADVAEILLTHGAEVNVHGPLGITPLILAAASGSRRTAEILLNHGADISTPTGRRDTALSEATAHGHQDIVQLLLKRVPVPTMNSMNAAASRGDIDALRLMLMHDELTHDVGEEIKNQALRYTILGGIDRLDERKQMIELLLSHGADIDNRPVDPEAIPVMLATTPELVDFLFAHGANKEAHVSGAQLARAFVCNDRVKDPIGVLQVLVKFGVDLRGTPAYPAHSAMSCATRSNNPALAQYLSDHGVGTGGPAPAAVARSANPAISSPTASAISSQNVPMRCAITQYTEWVRTLTASPAPDVKAKKLLEIDAQCGSSLHTADVQSGYEAHLRAGETPRPPAAPTPTAVAPTPPVPTTGDNSSHPSGPTPDGWPVTPDKHLASIKRIPPGDQIVLEVRNNNKIDVSNEIGVFNLTTHQEAKWDVLSGALREMAATQFGPQSDWAPRAGKLLYATRSSLHLVSRDGTAAELHPQMPGTLKALDGMTAYALSADGQRVAYLLYTRDIGERQPDGFGKLYMDLMVQQIAGSAPKSIWRDGFVLNPAWRPDGAAIAHTDSDHNLVVSDLDGRTLWSFHPGPAPSDASVADHIDEIRWDPTGKRLAFLMGSPIPRIYVVNADGSDMKVVEFRNFLGAARDLSIRSFAWSPDGRQFVFRSEAGSKCNYLALGYKLETGSFPCIFSRDLFTADVDGSHVTKVTSEPDYVFGELFWIQ